jgi:hypothetical protein
MRSPLVILERAVQTIRQQYLPTRRQLLDRTPSNSHTFREVRAYLLAITALWKALAVAYRDLAEQRQRAKFWPRRLAQLWAYPHEHIYQECKKQRDRTLTLYAFFVLIDERRSGSMPAWEGIGIVREKIQN